MQPPPPLVGTLPILAASRHWSPHTPTDGEGDEAGNQASMGIVENYHAAVPLDPTPAQLAEIRKPLKRLASDSDEVPEE
jgi:hypothetical protein